MPNQTRHWCFTVNNWTRDHEDLLEGLAPVVSYLVYGYETGEAGTPHLQGYVIFQGVKRFNEARTLLPPGCHIEAKRGTPFQAATYCKKDGLFKEWGTAPTESSPRSSPFDRFREWVLRHHQETGRAPTDRETANEFPTLFVRYRRNLQDLARLTCPEPVLEVNWDLRNWQNDLSDILQLDPDDRTILFYVDPDGGKGKSWFQRYMLSIDPVAVQCLSVGKRDDIAHAVDESKSIFLFNVPRGGMEFLNYHVLEQLKDRLVFSPKYDSRMKTLHRKPHVVVFCNEAPDMTKMTFDRYHLHEL
jgi:hypothetical protein